MRQHPTGTVTFLFSDIEGSTKLAREFPETWELSRSRHHQILRDAIESHNGFVFQIIGDAFCAAFYRAGDALQAAVKAQQGLHNETWGDCVIRVRMGIHTGEAELHEQEYQGYLALSQVQRIMSAGHGGQILISNATENLLRGQLPKDISLRDLGEHRFKDVPYPVRVFQALAPDLQQEFPPLRVLDVAPNNLPAHLTSFIGREKEVADVKRLLANTHLLTLIGPGGTGKTRLALEAARQVLHSFSHGVWFIDLAPVSDPSAVPSAVLSALSLPAELHRPAIDMLSDYLHEREALLILDNCEHLVEACAKMADRLLHAAPALRILASSREALGMAGEVSYRVPSLGLPDIRQLPSYDSLGQYEAVRLFIDRAQAAQPSFHVNNENAPAVAQICYRLDGIPLALELAAAKVRVLSVDEISKRLDDRFRLLTGGNRTALERHQTLRATLDWGHNLLPESEQVLFRRLSIFVDGWSLEAAESVCSTGAIQPEDVLELLEQLVNKSLVIAEEWQHETRYHMLETMRQYADEKLSKAGERERLRDRHLEYYVSLAETAAPHLLRPEQLEWLDRLEAEHENLRAALEWSMQQERPGQALRLTTALASFWTMHSYLKEGATWLERALAKPLQNPTRDEEIARARALVREAELADALDNLEQMRASAQASLALCERGSDRRDIALAKHWLGRAAMRMDDLETAQPLLEQSLREFRELKETYGEAVTEHFLTFVLRAKGGKRQEEKVAHDLELARKAGERLQLAEVLMDRADLAWMVHQMEDAEKYTEEAEALYQQMNFPAYFCFFRRGWIAHIRDEYRQAASMYGRVKELMELMGERNVRSWAINHLAVVARDMGDFQQAQLYVEEALELGREMASPRVIGYSLTSLGEIKFLQGHLADSKRFLKEGLSVVKELHDHNVKTDSLLRFFRAVANVQPVPAVQTLAMLDAYHRRELGQAMDPLSAREFEAALAQARGPLDENAFHTAWAEGENMTMGQAVELALKTVDKL